MYFIRWSGKSCCACQIRSFIFLMLQNKKEYHRPISTYSIDFKGHHGAYPDVIVRRKSMIANDGLSRDVLFSHGTDSQRQGHMISWYKPGHFGSNFVANFTDEIILKPSMSECVLWIITIIMDNNYCVGVKWAWGLQ